MLTQESLKILNNMKKVYGIIFAHSDLPKAYEKTLKSTFGKISNFAFLSNTGLSAIEMKRKLSKKISKIKNKNIVIFVDTIGGSCWQACLPLKDRFKNLAIVSGFNLPLLFKFLQYRDKVEFPTLLSRLVAAGKEAIKILE